MKELKVKVWRLRQNILDIIMAGGCGHIGGDMSVVDLLTVLLQPDERFTGPT